MPKRIFYLLPDFDTPSWGVGVIYYHVLMLCNNNFEAYIVHQNKGFRLSWLELNVSVKYFDTIVFSKNDLAIIPESIAYDEKYHGLVCEKIVFVQNVFFILNPKKKYCDYKKLGYSGALTILPHGKNVIEKFFNIKTEIVRPFIAPYYYQNQTQNVKRKKQIIFYPKSNNPDYDILIKILSTHFPFSTSKRVKLNPFYNDWNIVILQGKTHEEAAKLMKESMFFVNVNSREAFNTTVPEAMAAGCIVFAYEAYGGQDFLQNEKNAFVFPDHYIYEMIDKILELTFRFDSKQKQIDEMRKNALNTALYYTIDNAEIDLLELYKNIN